jgi:hypothetical protein
MFSLKFEVRNKFFVLETFIKLFTVREILAGDGKMDNLFFTVYGFWLDINWIKTIGWLSLLSHFHFSSNSETILKFLLRLNGSCFKLICSIYTRCLWETALYVEWIWMNHPVNAYIHALVKNMYLEVLKTSRSKIIQHGKQFSIYVFRKKI